MRRKQFVVLSDLHAHPWALFAKGDGAANSRLRRTLDELDRSLLMAERLNVPWVFPGDIVHTAGYALNVVLSALTEVFERHSDVEKIAVWGNHDARGIGGKITLEQTVFGVFCRTVDGLVVLHPDQEPYQAQNGLTFAGAGYQPTAELLQFAQQSDVGVYHQTVRGSSTAFGQVLNEGISRDIIGSIHRVSVVGHVHHPQLIAANVLIPGSPEHHNFGDGGPHGWWVVTMPDDEPLEYEMHPGLSPKFLTVDRADQVVRDSGDFYRVRAASRLEDLPPGVVAIAPTPSDAALRARYKGAVGPAMLQHWLEVSPPDAELPAERFMAVGEALLGPGGPVGAVRPLVLSVLNLENFCSYDRAQLVTQPGVSLVLGRGRDFPSNGAGKSTLFEALFWLLFGTTTKGLSGDDVIRYGEAACAVSARFVNPADHSEWVDVRRTRGKNAGLTVTTSEGPMEAASSAELTDNLLAYLGITQELYQALAYFSQERLLLFASATDGERKEMLSDLLGLEAFQVAMKDAASVCTAMEGTVVRATTLRDAAEADMLVAEGRVARLAVEVAAWDEQHMQTLNAAVGLIDQFDATAYTAERVAVRRAGIVAQLEPKIKAAQQRIADVSALVARAEPYDLVEELHAAEAASEVVKRATMKLTEAAAVLGATTRLSDEAAVALKRAAAVVKANKCPTCQQPISEAQQQLVLAPLQERAASFATEITQGSATVARLESALVDMRARETEATARVRGANTVSEWQSTIGELNGQVGQLQSILAEADLRAASEAADDCQARKSLLDRALADVENQINPHQQAFDDVRAQCALFATRRAEATTLRRQTQEEIAIHDYWRRAFSRTGLQSVLMDEIAAQFNDVRGDIFPALTQGVYDVQFQTISHTRAGEARERTEFQVFERGERTPYAALSGGQRRRIDVGVMLTLVMAVSRWMGSPGLLGILVLDEVFGFLDASGAEGLLEALREVQRQVPFIFVVSHDAQLQALFPQTILVEQDADGVSRLAE